MVEHASVLERLAATVAEEPARPLFSFVGERGEPEGTLTAAQLWARAAGVSAYLRRTVGVRPGDRVALVYPPSLDFVVALFGCMLAGAIPVPLAPPDPMNPRSDLARFAALVASCTPRAVLTNASYQRARLLAGARDTFAGLLGRARPAWPDLPWHTTDGLKGDGTPVPRAASDVALLQYTSGSTSTPRGVRITYGNLAHQLACNAEELGIDGDARAVFWVPHFHDFGLVSGILSAAFSRAHITMMSPLTFLRRPHVWMDQLSRVRGTHTAAPNFAWDLVVRKTTPAQRAAWDLSALRVAMSAAEPVRDEVVRRFCEAFAPSGFRPDAFCPAYGLAEHTVGVSVGGRGRLAVERGALERGELRRSPEVGPRSQMLVGCGRPSRDVVVRVVDPETRRALPAGAIGELWVDSPSKADGYWGDEAASRATFEARLADPDDTRGYLRTGDLGALVDGEVYVTGRLKELLIVGGRNLYPEDLEDTVRDAHPDIRPGGVAAFAVDPGDGAPERLVLLLEARTPPTRATAEEIALAARKRLLADHQVRCETVVVGAPHLVLKTSSGKVRRLACRAAFLAGELGADAIAVQADWPAEPSVATEPPAPEPPEDPRVTSLAPSFEALIANAARYLSAAPADRGEKAPRGIAARGWLEVRPAPELPAHRFFAAGRRFRVILRHDNRTTADDAAPDARVASLRLLRDDATDLDAAALDLPMLTGRCFFHRTAEDFFRFSVGSAEVRDGLLRAEPHRGRAAWEGVRIGERYGQFHYHSQTVGRFVAADGGAWFVRYRLRAPEVTEDGGFVDPAGSLFPPTAAPRLPGETRPATCLRDAFAATIDAGGARYVLEAQLAPVSTDPAVNEARLDCTRPWPEDAHPWRALASVHLDRLLDPAATGDLAFNPANAPEDLGVVHARHERQSASIDHVRTIVYEVAASARSGRALSPGVAALLARPARLRTVAVVGAGASGLSVARSLEEKGYTVTVFERAPEIGGMCATLSLDGRPCDVGGHMIFPDAYPNVVALAKRFDLPLVPDFPDCTVSLATGEVLPRDAGPSVRAAKARASGIVLRSGALEPGTAAVDPALAVPASEWIEREGLEALWGWMGPIFTGAGYGYAEDHIPAAYLVKALRHTGDQERRWQLRDGFQALWERVAASLRDVRTGHEVRSVTRDERGVRLVTRRAGADGALVEETHRFDQLVIAHSPAAAAYLDRTDEERDLFGRVRHLRYVSAWLTVEGLPADMRERWCFLPEHTGDARKRGHVLAFVHTGGNTDLVAVIAYAPPGGLSEAESLYAADFARLGARLVRTRWIHEWAYFPHFSADDLRAGCLARLEALQGARHTWHASTLLSFELTECAVTYAAALADRIAGGTSTHLSNSSLGTGAPAPVTPPGTPVRAPTSYAEFRAIVAAEVARMEGWLQSVIVEELDADTPVPPPDLDLAHLGIDSLRAVRIHQRISDELDLALEPTLLSDMRDIRSLARHLVAEALPRPSAETP